MKLHKIIAGQTFFSLVQQLSKLVLSTIINIIVIRNLDRDAYGLIGIASGYFVIITWLLITPQSYLLKEFNNISKKALGEFISNSLSFSWWRNVGLFIFSIGIGTFLAWQQNDINLIWIFTLFYIAQSLINLIGETQFFLKLLFLQKETTIMTISATVIRIILLAGLFIDSSIFIYLSLLILSELAEFVLSLHLLSTKTHMFFKSPIKSFNHVSKALKEFSIWHHIIGNLTNVIYRIDTVFLSFLVSLEVIGNYNIALQMANFTFILPSLLQNSVSLALTRLDNSESANRATSVFIKYSMILAVAQVIGFAIIGKFYIGLHTDTDIGIIYTYSMLLVTGTGIINLGRPLISYIFNRTEIKSFLIQSLLPTVAFTLLVYFSSAYFYGGIGIAAANIAAYSFWLMMMAIYAWQNGFRFNAKLIEPEEISMIKNFLKLK